VLIYVSSILKAGPQGNTIRDRIPNNNQDLIHLPEVPDLALPVEQNKSILAADPVSRL
jgi:hypothetical protein